MKNGNTLRNGHYATGIALPPVAWPLIERADLAGLGYVLVHLVDQGRY
jgi:hypothetical protein